MDIDDLSIIDLSIIDLSIYDRDIDVMYDMSLLMICLSIICPFDNIYVPIDDLYIDEASLPHSTKIYLIYFQFFNPKQEIIL